MRSAFDKVVTGFLYGLGASFAFLILRMLLTWVAHVFGAAAGSSPVL